MLCFRPLSRMPISLICHPRRSSKDLWSNPPLRSRNAHRSRRPLGGVDEVQRLQNLLSELHRFLEEKRFQFLLCGSTARGLKRAGVSLLAGRVLLRPSIPLSRKRSEAGLSRRGLSVCVAAGCLGLNLKGRDAFGLCPALSEREIRTEAAFVQSVWICRFSTAGALLHSQMVNMNNMAHEAGVARTKAIGYLEILEETLLCFRRPVCEAKLRVRNGNCQNGIDVMPASHV